MWDESRGGFLRLPLAGVAQDSHPWSDARLCMSFEVCTKIVQVWGAGRGSLQPLAEGARGEPQMDTDGHGCRGAETESGLGGETRDGERQTRRRVADGYCIVKSKESIRNDLHSSKRRGERQAQRPFSRRENSGSPSGRRVSHAAWVRLTFKFSIDMGRHDGVPCNRRRGI